MLPYGNVARSKMKRTRVTVISSAVISFFFALTLVAQIQPSYVLITDGSVRVNGVPAPRMIAISSGDVIETASGASGKISAPGTSILVGQNSHVSAVGNQLVVNSGSAVVSTTNGISTQLPQYSVTPAGSGAAKYQVAIQGSSSSVVSSVGQLKITSPAGSATNLATGQTVVLSSGQSSISSVSGTLGSAPPTSFVQSSKPFISPPCRNNRQCP